MSDIDTAVVDSLKALDPNRPIREADKVGFRASDDLSAYDPYATKFNPPGSKAGRVDLLWDG